MATILHINSSARTAGSISRELTGQFLRKWLETNPGDTIVERDLTQAPIPHLTEEMIGAFFTPAADRTPQQARIVKLSDELVDELLAADVVVIAAPMYNFSITSSLKAWIDHVCRAGRTFKYTENGPVGLIEGKKVYVFTSRGGVYSQGPGKSMDYHETYLRAVLGFIGIKDITFVHTEGLGLGAEAAEKAVAQSRSAIEQLVAAEEAEA